MTRVLPWLLVAACYSPDVSECTVMCSSNDDCATGHVCGSDHFCATPETAGHCKSMAMPDAGAMEAPKVPLQISINGRGRVTVLGIGACNENDSPCTLMVPKSVARSLTAVETEEGHPFERWTTPNCNGQGTTCVVTPNGSTTVGAKFR